MSVKETSALMPNIRERISDDEYRTYYFGSKAKFIEAEGQDGSVTDVQQEIENLYDAIENSGSGGADIDYSSLKTKVTKSDINGNITVDEEEVKVYNDQELQGKTATDQNYTYRAEGSSISFNYFADEEDILGGYPSPATGDYGAITPNPLSLSDEAPCRIYLSPKKEKVWTGGMGKSKVRFNVLAAYSAGNYLLYADEKNFTISLDSEYIGQPTPAFNITIAKGVNLDSETKYILNGFDSDAVGLSFEISGDGLTAKTGTEIIFNGTTNITIKLIGETNFQPGEANLIHPMVRLATEYDDSFEPWEHMVAPIGLYRDFILKQTNASLDVNEVSTPEESHFFTIPYYVHVQYNTFDGPDGNTYNSFYRQVISNGTDTYTIEFYSNYGYALDDGYAQVVKYYDTDYDESGRFYELQQITPSGYWQWKLNNGEFNEGQAPIFSGDTYFASKYETVYYNDSEYHVIDSTITYFESYDDMAQFLKLGLYYGIIDLGLYTYYSNAEIYIGYHQKGEGNVTPFEYVSDRDVCDMRNWHEPSEGALVIANRSDDYEYCLDTKVFDTKKITMDFYEKTNITLALYNYFNGNTVLVKNPYNVFVFTCRPGNSVSRVTYTHDTSLVEAQGYSGQTSLAQPNSYDQGTYIMSGKYPKKEVTSKKLEIEFDGQNGYPSADPVAWNSQSPFANLTSFENWAKGSSCGSEVNISRYTYDYIETFNVYWSSSYRSQAAHVNLYSSLDTLLDNGQGLSIGFKIKDTDFIPALSDAYGYLSKTGSATDYTNIKFKLNDLSSIPTIIYDSSYKYLGFYIKNPSIMDEYYSDIIIMPIIRKAPSYTYPMNWGDTGSAYYPTVSLVGEKGYMPEKSMSIAPLIAANRAETKISKRYVLHQDRYKDGLINFSNINFYDIVCPYNNNHYKYFYFVTKAQDMGVDTYNRDYYGTLEIWSNTPIIYNLSGYGYYYYQDENKFIPFDNGAFSDPITFEEENFYMKYTGPEDEEYASYNILANGGKYFEKGQTNIPFFETIYADGITIEDKPRDIYDSINGATYVSSLVSLEANNQVYGLKIDLKNKRIYKTYDYVPVFELGYDTSDYTVGSNNLLWNKFKSTKADARYEDYPAQGQPALIRVDRYLRDGIEVDSSCYWDVTFENFDCNELILPTAEQDSTHYVDISVVLVAGEPGDTVTNDYGSLYLQYVGSGLAFVEDVQDLQVEIDKANGRIDTLMTMIISSLNGSY